MPSPATYNGMLCPNRLSFGRVHGTQPAVGTLEFDGTVEFPLGSLNSIQIGAATYVGMCIRNEEVFNPQEVDSTSKVIFVDWRDRLHDNHIFCAFNMQDNDGRFYHIFPGANWAKQQKTFVNRELDVADWDDVQAGGVDEIEALAAVGLISGWTILNWIADQYSFIWTASPMAADILQSSRPENLNWNDGAKVVSAIQTILDKNGLRFTVYGTNQMYISIRGHSEDAFTMPFLEGQASICDIGGSSGARGQEMNPKGQRAIVVGDRNKHQFAFVCHPDWNANWTQQFCLNYFLMSATLFKNNLTVMSKVGELPEKYRDSTELPAGSQDMEHHTRNDLTIREYLDQIAWKTYIVNGGVGCVAIDRDQDSLDAWYKTIDRDDYTMGAGGMNYAAAVGMPWNTRLFKGPLARNLVDISNKQSVVFCTESLMVQGKSKTFSDQKTFVAQESGAKLEVIPQYAQDGTETWRITVSFNEMKRFLAPGLNPKDLDNFVADRVLVKLAVEGELFRHVQGAGPNTLRVREQKRRVSNLYKAFINGTERSVLRLNFQGQMRALGLNADQPVMATDLAQRIAAQMLFHEAITRSGNVKYTERAGAVCDGMIESVNLSWTPRQGISETVSFTSDEQDDDWSVGFSVIKLERDFDTDEDMKLKMMHEIATEALKNNAQVVAAPGQQAAIGREQGGGRFNAAVAAANIGARGLMVVNATAEVVQSQGELKAGQPLIVTEPTA